MTPRTAKTCQRCGFVPKHKHMCLLGVIHICSDAHDPSNYMTLCLNCQRLQEAMRGGHLSPAEAADLRDYWRQGNNFN